MLSMLFTVKPVSGYIDPASTSYIIQIAAGVVIAIGTVIGVYRNKIKRFFKSKFGKEKEETLPAAERTVTKEKENITAEDLLSDDR